MRIDYGGLYARSTALRLAFQAAQPFPHVVIDNFLPRESYATTCDAFPADNSDIWKTPESQHTRGKSVTKRGDLDLKEALYEERQRRIFHELNSGMFLRFLEMLTGIQGLVGDPYLAEAGFHRVVPGGYLDIHADFSHHDHTGLERRLNLLLYLNDGWREEWGGALSLYDGALRPARTFLPIGNRCVVFATSATSYHGHPEPLRSPQPRCSIAMYYYSVPTDRKRHLIIFPADPEFVHEVTRG